MSAATRRAASGLPWPLGPGVTPNAARPALWRAVVARNYFAPTISAPPHVYDYPNFVTPTDRLSFRLAPADRVEFTTPEDFVELL